MEYKTSRRKKEEASIATQAKHYVGKTMLPKSRLKSKEIQIFDDGCCVQSLLVSNCWADDSCELKFLKIERILPQCSKV